MNHVKVIFRWREQCALVRRAVNDREKVQSQGDVKADGVGYCLGWFDQSSTRLRYRMFDEGSAGFYRVWYEFYSFLNFGKIKCVYRFHQSSIQRRFQVRVRIALIYLSK